MRARLIINADDFGLTPGINRSIEELHRAGVLRSATLMANGPAFQDALTVANRNASLGVGCHVVLTDGLPVSPPESIPSLLGSDGRSFRPSLLQFASAAVLGQLREQDICTEALAQIRKLQHAGLSVTHLDTHKHAHLFPAVSRPLFDAARQTSVPAIRYPFEPPWSLGRASGARDRQMEVRLLNRLKPRFHAAFNLHHGLLATTDGTIGIAATGHLDEPVLRDLLQNLPEGTWELVCHPGYGDPDLDLVRTRLRTHRDIERKALLDVVPQVLSRPDAPSLIHYGDLPRGFAPGSALSSHRRP